MFLRVGGGKDNLYFAIHTTLVNKGMGRIVRKNICTVDLTRGPGLSSYLHDLRDRMVNSQNKLSWK